MKRLIATTVGLVAIVLIGAVLVVSGQNAFDGERADIGGQGGEEPLLATNGAELTRASDGLRVRAVVPTPVPGSYEYPTGDMVPPWAEPHPEVVPGGADEPEAFTMWVFVFNYPDMCTDNTCDLDDLGKDAPAKGGAYQADGGVADGDELDLAGSVRLGQDPASGSSLENPLGAEVHFAIAPHGKALSGSDLERQINGPLGNPTLWWAASFTQ